MATDNRNKPQPKPQPQPQPNHKQAPTNNGRFIQDRRPQNIESVQPPRPQPGGSKNK